MGGRKTDVGLMQLLARLFAHLTPHRRAQFVLVLGLMLASAIAEVISLGAVVPFLGVLTAPERALAQPTIARFAHGLGIVAADNLLLPVTIAFAAAALAAAAIRILFLWVGTRVAFGAGTDLSIKVYRLTLYQPYPAHLARNSSAVISGVIDKINGATAVLVTLLAFGSSVFILVAVMAALLAVDPLTASFTAAAFGVCYAGIALTARRKLRENSRRIAAEQTQVIKALQEGLGGIRDVLLDGTQEVFSEIYRRADIPLRRAHGNNSFLTQSPRFAMEALGIVLIASVAYVLSRSQGGLTAAIPTLGALALGAQRMLPALQQAYASWAGIAGSHESLVQALELLDQPQPPRNETPAQPIQWKDTIRVEGLKFRYGPGAPFVLDGVDLTIRRGARVGIVGGTGSGKSTLIDLLMGLLEPTEGRLLVDEQAVDRGRMRSWQRTLAHVPQSIYLTDGSIAENIAFGVPDHAVDMQRVRLAARQAHIADFIEAAPEGYATRVGERGVRLSGGQRQRIGIARALYKQASVLIFDEATSALDNATERAVMSSIEELDRELTILIVAHRLSTLADCDTIVELAGGRVASEGSYEKLVTGNDSATGGRA